MIECWYCCTRNDNKAAVCQACGGPLTGQQEITEETIECPDPLNPGKFVQVGSINHFNVNTVNNPGVTAEEFADNIYQMMRMF
jgi:hypothetical protein